MSARVALRVVVALAGIVVTAALTWSVQRLTGERIGLSSTPPTVIRGLAPARPRASHSRPASDRGSSSSTGAAKPSAAGAGAGTATASGGSAPASASSSAPAATPPSAGDRGDDSGDRPGGSGRDD